MLLRLRRLRGLEGAACYLKRLFQNMLREDTNNRARDRSGGDEKIGREALYRFAMRQKLILPDRGRRTSCSCKFIHRGVTDLTKDRFVTVQHRKSERLAFVVITNYPPRRQRHRMAQSPSSARLLPYRGLCREG